MSADQPVAADLRRLVLTDPRDVRVAAGALAFGGIVAHGFANHYVFSTRPDALMMSRLNALTRRPRGQPASILTKPGDVRRMVDWSRVPNGVTRQRIHRLVERLGALGPFGLRCPVARNIPAHLTSMQGGIRTAVVVSPGLACPSNTFVVSAQDAIDGEMLCCVPASRSNSDSSETPPHWSASELRAEFGEERGLIVLEHADDHAALAAYPGLPPTAVSVLGLHTTVDADPLGWPQLTVERQGSLGAGELRPLLEELGFGLVLAAGAESRAVSSQYQHDQEEKDEG